MKFQRTDLRARPQRGLTLLEVLIILGVAGLLATLALPELMSVIRRSRVEGAAQTLTRRLLEARAEAIYRGSPVIVHADIRADPDGNPQHFLVAWVDVDENGKFDGTIDVDGIYAADPGEPFRSVDYPLFDYMLPWRGPTRTNSNVYFWGAPDSDPTVEINTIDGLTTKADGVDEEVMTEDDGYGDFAAAVVFLPNGSVAEEGGIRFAMGPFDGTDTEINYLELRIAPKASGRIELRKYIPDPFDSYEPKGYDDDAAGGLKYEWEWY